MAKSTNDFLLEYYKRLLFNNMPLEKFAKFCDYVKNNDMSGNMKHWARDLLEHDPNNPDILLQDAAKLYIRKPNLNPTAAPGVVDEWARDDNELQKLFKAVQNTFRSMSANKSSFKYDDKANKFLDKWFGDGGQLFTHAKIDPQYRDQIEKLKTLLNDYPDIEKAFSDHFNDDFSFKDFKDGLKDEKYNKDPKFQKRLTNFISYFNYALQNDSYGSDRASLLNKIRANQEFRNIDNWFTDVDKWFDDDAFITTNRLGHFRGQLTDLLDELNSNKNAFDAFSANDNSKISKSLIEARQHLDYNNKDSKDFVPPKREDELTLGQYISDWVKNTYSENLEKYVKLRGDRMYFSPQTKLMVKAIDSCKIKPTDGLEKIISEKGKINDLLRGKYSSPKAADHFDWFAKKMDEYKTAMPKAFAGALHNGAQMHRIIEELAADATEEGKMDEAKSALELLSVVKYGLVTSRVMDNIAKDPLTLFSDKGLSWNKNDGMKFVTTAMDKTINTAIKLTGRVITMGVNAVRLNYGSKFNGKMSKQMAARHDVWKQKHDAELTRKTAVNASADALDNTAQKNAENTLIRLAADGLTDATLDSKQRALDTARQTEEPLKQKLDQANQRQDAAQEILEHQKNFDELSKQIKQLQNNQNRTPYEDMELQLLAEQYNELRNAIAQERGWNAFDQQAFNKEVANARRDYTKINNDAIDAQSTYDAIHSQNEQNAQKIQEFNDATQALKEIKARRERREKDMATWNKNNSDKFRELMAYWDFLETGRTSHMSKMYSWRLGTAKAAQTRFDKKKNDMFNKYLNDYQMAA